MWNVLGAQTQTLVNSVLTRGSGGTSVRNLSNEQRSTLNVIMYGESLVLSGSAAATSTGDGDGDDDDDDDNAASSAAAVTTASMPQSSSSTTTAEPSSSSTTPGPTTSADDPSIAVLDSSSGTVMEETTSGTLSNSNLTYIGMALGVVILTFILVIFGARNCNKKSESMKQHSLPGSNFNAAMEQYAMSMQNSQMNIRPPGTYNHMQNGRAPIDPWDGGSSTCLPMSSVALGEYNVIGGAEQQQQQVFAAAIANANVNTPNNNDVYNDQQDLSHDQQAWLTRAMGSRFFPEVEAAGRAVVAGEAIAESVVSNGDSFHPGVTSGPPPGVSSAMPSKPKTTKAPHSNVKKQKQKQQQQKQQKQKPKQKQKQKQNLSNQDLMTNMMHESATHIAQQTVPNDLFGPTRDGSMQMRPLLANDEDQEPIYGRASEDDPLASKPPKKKKGRGQAPRRQAAKKEKGQKWKSNAAFNLGLNNKASTMDIVQARLQHDQAAASGRGANFWPADTDDDGGEEMVEL